MNIADRWAPAACSRPLHSYLRSPRPTQVTPEGFGRRNQRSLYLARALSSAVEHTRYTGGVACSIRAAPTIVLDGRGVT